MKRQLWLLLAAVIAVPCWGQAFGQIPLKQSTQVEVSIGPAMAVANCTVPVTTLALNAADEAELLKANGAATVDISGGTMAAVTGADGWYDLTLTTSHTDTVGPLTVVINDDSLICPIFAKFMVVEEAVYDACCAASAAPLTAANVVDEFETQSQADPTGFHVNVLEVNGTAQTANDNGADINAILADTGTDGVVVAAASKTGYALSATGLDSVVVTEPSGVPAWTTGTILEAVEWLLALARNELNQTSSEACLRNDADDADIACAATSDNGTTFVRGEYAVP